MSQLKTYFGYKKFAAPVKRILFLDKGYFLQAETILCLKQTGHQVYTLPVADQPKVMLENLLKACVAFRPDAVMSMNHFGFDPEGKINALLYELSIPVIFWYLDDFRFIIQQAENLTWPNVLLFTFEPYDVSALQQLGFEHVYYLPTATALSPDKKYYSVKFPYLHNALCYVGSSFEPTKKAWFRPGYAEKLAQLNLDGFFKRQETSVVDFIERHQAAFFDSKQTLYHYAGYVSAQVSQLHRLNILRAVQNHNLHIFGDAHWKTLRLKAALHPPVDNCNAAPAVYAAAQINLNISSSQLKRGVNLRLYDVPASGGFLITDWRDALSELFDEKKELVVYRSVEELQSLITFYQKNPSAKETVVKAARARIAGQHLLRHRLQRILDLATDLFS